MPLRRQGADSEFLYPLVEMRFSAGLWVSMRDPWEATL